MYMPGLFCLSGYSFSMKQLFLFGLLLATLACSAQELFPYTEPASNMPAKSLSLKSTVMYYVENTSGKNFQRYMPELMLGRNKKWMTHLGAGFSNMQQERLIWEGVRVYNKYRFLSNDDVHKHFRMAAYALAAYSRNDLDRNEINLAMGDQSGLASGLIATQLWNKLAVSGTAGWNEVLSKRRGNKQYADQYAFQAVNYSLSAGYLLLPFAYKSYNQTNLNLYVEMLGSRNVNFPAEKYYLDLAPSVQAIFNSTAKLNLGYRFQLRGDIFRTAKNSFLLSFEYIFLNALKR